MTCTKRQCGGINLVKRWGNHRWFPRETLFSRGVNSWSPALTKCSLNINSPCPLGERAGGLLPLERPSCPWTAQAVQSAGSRGDLRGGCCSCDTWHSLMLSSLSSDYVFATFLVPSSVGWGWALSPFTRDGCRAGRQHLLLQRLDVKGWCGLGDLAVGSDLAQWLWLGPGNRSQKLTASSFLCFILSMIITSFNPLLKNFWENGFTSYKCIWNK